MKKITFLYINKQSGITLLLSILVLSAILAISFSLATIMLIELRTSGDLLRTEGALFGASGVVEEAIFNVKRQTCTSSCNYTSKYANNVSITTPISSSTSTPVFQDVVLPNSAFINTENKYDFCVSGSGTGGCGYGKVEITYTGGLYPIFVYLCEFDASGGTVYPGEPCTNPDYSGFPGYWSQRNIQMSAITNPFVSWNLDTDKQQRLIITNLSPSQNAYVKIKTYDTDRVTGKGLPYVGQTAVDIDAINLPVDRKIRVIVPNK